MMDIFSYSWPIGLMLLAQILFIRNRPAVVRSSVVTFCFLFVLAGMLLFYLFSWADPGYVFYCMALLLVARLSFR